MLTPVLSAAGDQRGERGVVHLRTAAAAVALVGALAGGIVVASPASASGWANIRSNSGGAWLRAQPSTSAYGMEYLGNGTSVLMMCYIDAQWATGNYSSNRWFRVEPAYDGSVGYVHSSLVANQVGVPRC